MTRPPRMKALQKAALLRAYRTLAQSLAGGTVTTALAGIVVAMVSTEPNAGITGAALVAAAAVAQSLLAAFQSYWLGIAQGLPEVS